MSDKTAPEALSSRWILEFEKQIQRRKHIVLYGNLHDAFLWQGEYYTASEFLHHYFRRMRFDLTVRYDPTDGLICGDELSAAPSEDQYRHNETSMRTRFHDLVRKQVSERNSQRVGNAPAACAPDLPVSMDMRVPPPRQSPARQTGASMSRRIPPDEFFGSLRVVLGQSTTSAVACVFLGDMMTADAGRYMPEERQLLMLLKKVTLEASVIREGPLLGYRNTLVITAEDLTRVPEWIYRGNPFVGLVQARLPDRAERRVYALNFVRPGPDSVGFYGGELILNQPAPGQSHSELETFADEFADMTEGFQAMDLEALRHTSWKEQIPIQLNACWRLIDFFKFDQRSDPWEALSPGRVRRARAELSQSVIGQPTAIEAVTTMLTGARVGLSLVANRGRSSRPKGVFFFVGPTGVGKTELAKALSNLVFGDESAFARFDMSEYKEEHAAEKLAGAPPGFEGYEEGGHLTNRMLEHPHSILLFDEIEKAHPRALDKFLQVLEDGRLTDGKGQTAYFNQAVIIFTSNIGASDLTDPQNGRMLRQGIMNRVRMENVHEFTYAQVAAHFRAEVDWYFTSRIGRAELLSRLGDNIIVFDLLRPSFVMEIGQKFLNKLRDNAQDKYHLTLCYEPSLLEMLSTRMAEKDNMLFGGRRIKSLLESLVERPLNGWIFENFPDLSLLADHTLKIGLNTSGQLEVDDV